MSVLGTLGGVRGNSGSPSRRVRRSRVAEGRNAVPEIADIRSWRHPVGLISHRDATIRPSSLGRPSRFMGCDDSDAILSAVYRCDARGRSLARSLDHSPAISETLKLTHSPPVCRQLIAPWSESRLFPLRGDRVLTLLPATDRVPDRRSWLAPRRTLIGPTET